MLNIKDIKLIIWDLDDTFWHGILSEEKIEKLEQNIDFVKMAVDKGIMNSICSKNDMGQVKKVLSSDEFDHIWDFFVFASVDWTAKAARVRQIIEDMALRPENVLYIDDQEFNLREVKYELPLIMTESPSIISDLFQQLRDYNKQDKEHKRLVQYRILEKKRTEQKRASSNLEFLMDSEICIEFLSDCESHFERVHELLLRTNQLNFTKLRITENELHQLLADDTIECTMIRLKDKFGDYGIIGFYALKKTTPHTLVHFAFSCRALGMGVEQYVYQKLHYPMITILGDTAIELKKEYTVTWIRETQDEDKEWKRDDGKIIDDQKISIPRILLKGPCDMSSMIPYLKENVKYELETNFVDDRGVIVAGSNNSMHIYELYNVPLSVIRETIKDAPFMSEADFLTFMLTDPYDTIVFSTLSEGHTGIYRHKQSGVRICFGSCNFDLTNKENWAKIISGEYVNHNYPFTEKILTEFTEKFIFEGHLKPELVVRNLIWLRSRLPQSTKLILLLGSEIEAEHNKEEFAEHAPIYSALNHLISHYMNGLPNVDLINVTDFITGQDCFEDCTNHYAKIVYKKLAERINNTI